MKTTVLLSALIVSGTVAFVPQSAQRPYHQISLISSSSSSSSSQSRITSIKALSTDEETRPATAPISMPFMSNGTSALSTTATGRHGSIEETFLQNHKQLQQDSTVILPAWVENAAWRSVIVVLCAVWASNFAVAKVVMAEPGVDSSLYALSRFGVAAAALAPFALNGLRKANMDWETLKSAVICGTWVAFGYLGQTLGLMTTTASKSCVICSMHCVFVAVVAEYWRVQQSAAESTGLDAQFDIKRLLPAAIAVAGVAIVELHGAGGAPTIGDALSFAQPIGFGMGYLILENLMAKKPEAALPVSAIKLAVVAVASFLMFELTPLVNGNGGFVFSVPDFSGILSSNVALGGILYTGLITTALALWVESIAFAKVPATDASLILTIEPLFAAGCGALALGETFGTSDYIGAGLIVSACALSIFVGKPHNGESDELQHDLLQ